MAQRFGISLGPELDLNVLKTDLIEVDERLNLGQIHSVEGPSEKIGAKATWIVGAAT